MASILNNYLRPKAQYLSRQIADATKTAIKRRISKKAEEDDIGFLVCLPGLSMMYIIGMHQRSLGRVELSEEEEQALKESAINNVMERYGLTPENPYHYFHTDAACCQPPKLSKEEQELKESAIKSVMERYGLTPENPYHYFHTDAACCQPPKLSKEEQELKESAIKSLMEDLGLTPEHPYKYFHTDAACQSQNF